VVVVAPTEELASGARALGAMPVYGSYRDESVLRPAGVPEAGALVIEDDDVGNLHARSPRRPQFGSAPSASNCSA
jgi:hypothetical protein